MRSYRAFFLGLLLLVSCFLSGCGQQSPEPSASTRTVTDCAGRSVEIPVTPESICCVCPFSGPFIVMFGAGDSITSACYNMTRSELLRIICPAVEDATVVKNSGSLNAESILDLDTDLILVDGSTYRISDERSKLDTMGIPYIVIDFTDLESQLDAVEFLGTVFDQEEKAEEYTAWCRCVYSDISATVSQLNSSPIRLYHAVNEATRTDEEGSICAQWITMTGVINVSADKELEHDGEKTYTTLEEIYSWDPDMIICNEAGVDDYILSDSKWAGLRCVRTGDVYQIPVGFSRMGHPTSTETPLAAMWLMNLLYPEQYDIDFKAELQTYYHTFYDYDIGEELTEAILAGDGMRSARTVVPA